MPVQLLRQRLLLPLLWLLLLPVQLLRRRLLLTPKSLLLLPVQLLPRLLFLALLSLLLLLPVQLLPRLLLFPLLLPRGGTVTSGISVVVSLSLRLVAVHQGQVCVVLRDRQASVRPVLGESTRGFDQ